MARTKQSKDQLLAEISHTGAIVLDQQKIIQFERERAHVAEGKAKLCEHAAQLNGKALEDLQLVVRAFVAVKYPHLLPEIEPRPAGMYSHPDVQLRWQTATGDDEPAPPGDDPDGRLLVHLYRMAKR